MAVPTRWPVTVGAAEEPELDAGGVRGGGIQGGVVPDSVAPLAGMSTLVVGAGY